MMSQQQKNHRPPHKPPPPDKIKDMLAAALEEGTITEEEYEEGTGYVELIQTSFSPQAMDEIKGVIEADGILTDAQITKLEEFDKVQQSLGAIMQKVSPLQNEPLPPEQA